MVKQYKSRTNFNSSLMDEVWERDGGKCIYCGEPAQQIDHVVPRSKGGKGIRANAVCACLKCNSKKKGNLQIDFITRGLFYLATVGENTDWVDRVGEKRLEYSVK